MKRIRFNIPIYGFSVTFIEVENKSDKDYVVREMKNVKITSDDIEEVKENIERECTNGGICFRNGDLNKFLVIIYPCKNEEKRREVINHEKRHIEDRILEWVGVQDIEAAAYLAGYISRYIY